MTTLDVRFTTGPLEPGPMVGQLLEQRGRIYFEYHEDWLKTGLNLSPFRLPFQGGVFEHKDRAFGPLPGLFDDSLPDGWGLLLMDRHFRGLGLELASLGPLERLGWLGRRTMGALTYHPPDGSPRGGGRFDLDDLARQSRELKRPGDSQLLQVAMARGVSRSEASAIMDEVRGAVDRWPEFAKQAGVSGPRSREIGSKLGAR